MHKKDQLYAYTCKKSTFCEKKSVNFIRLSDDMKTFYQSWENVQDKKEQIFRIKDTTGYPSLTEKWLLKQNAQCQQLQLVY